MTPHVVVKFLPLQTNTFLFQRFVLYLFAASSFVP
jgi:hypothetical protein